MVAFRSAKGGDGRPNAFAGESDTPKGVKAWFFH